MMDQVPGWLIGLVISAVTSLIVFNGTFSSVQTKVEANTEKINKTVSKEEFKAIVEGQEKMVDLMNKRMDRIEVKIDKLR